MRLVVFALLFIACGAPPVEPVLPLVADPGSVGFSAARLQRLSAAMQGHVDAQRLPGVVTLVARRGQVVHFEAFGMQDREAGIPMQRDSIFRIYSMTKPIVSVAALMLFERGALQLSDPVADFLPELAELRVIEDPRGPLDRTVPLARPPTIRDLLVHSAGLSYEWILPDGPLRDAYTVLDQLLATDALTLPQLVQHLAELPLAYQPGTRWNYGLSIDVVGRVVEVVSGERLDDFLRQEIFEPLGMRDTGFFVPAEKLARFTATYTPVPGPGLELRDAPRGSLFARSPFFLSGGGGLVSTAVDYARFAQMLLQGGELSGVRILSPKTVALLGKNHLSEQELEADFLRAQFPGFGFGLAGSVVMDVTATQLPGSVGQWGWNGAAGTTFFIDPREQLVVIQMTQVRPFPQISLPDQLRVLVYSALED